MAASGRHRSLAKSSLFMYTASRHLTNALRMGYLKAPFRADIHPPVSEPHWPKVHHAAASAPLCRAAPLFPGFEGGYGVDVLGQRQG